MKLFAFLLGITIPLISLFLSVQIFPTIKNILFSPFLYLSSFLDIVFKNLPFYIHSMVMICVALIFSIVFFYFSKIFLRRVN